MRNVWTEWMGRHIVILMLLPLSGCSYVISSAADEFGRNLQQAVLNSNDPDTVAEAIPAYLLLQETLLVNDPDDEAMLNATARLYAAYSALLVHPEPARIQGLSTKALALAKRAACLHKSGLCQIQQQSYQDFASVIEHTDKADLDFLFTLGSAWSGWIQAYQGDWHAVAQLPQVKLMMTRIVGLDQRYRDGEAYLYLGLMESILPPALGGKPDLARRYFEKARSLSGNKNLMIDVLYAQYYARMIFDRDLHDSLLKGVIAANPQQKGLTLTNTLAQKRAFELLQSADDYY